MVWEGVALIGDQPKQRTYKVTGALVYEGVINSHPRFKIPIEASPVDQTGAVGRTTVTNVDSGDSIYLFGVNHWNWDGNTLYVFPVYESHEYNPSIKARADRIIKAGATIVLQNKSCPTFRFTSTLTDYTRDLQEIFNDKKRVR